MQSWRNWAGNQSYTVGKIFKPTKTQQIVEIIQSMRSQKKTIRAIGRGHSYSPLFKGADYLISLEKFDHSYHCDTENQQGTFQSSYTLGDANSILYSNGFSLPCMGHIQRQLLAGAISTGTHGPSLHHPIISDSIIGLKLINGLGEEVHIDHTSPYLEAARVSLGLLGVITEITLKLSRKRHLVLETELLPLDTWLDQFEASSYHYEYYDTFYFSHLDKVFVMKGFSTDEVQPFSISPSSYLDNFAPSMHYILSKSASYLPFLSKWVQLVYMNIFLRHQKQTGPICKLLNIESNQPFLSSEFAIPIEKFKEVMQLIIRTSFKTPFMIDIRGIKSDNNWLSMGYHQDSISLGMIFPRMPDMNQTPLSGFNEIFHQFQARPHWAKMGGQEKINLFECYPKLQEFLSIREIFDPENIFYPKKLEKLFFK